MDNKIKKSAFSKFMNSTSWVVWVTAILVGVVMFLQKFLIPSESIEGMMVAGTVLPHNTLAWVFTAIASGYAGTDRIAQFARTSTLEYGQADLGDPRKLRWVILVTLILIAEALVLTVFFGVPNLALDALVTAFGGTGISYVVGNKAIKAAASKSGAHKAQELNQYHVEGKDTDGTGTESNK